VVFVLYEVEGFSGKEIAETLGINEATVRTRLFHARRELIERCEKLARSEKEKS
jgi:RNA polymerase sigma-70 factor (ECF subfamily)